MMTNYLKTTSLLVGLLLAAQQALSAQTGIDARRDSVLSRITGAAVPLPLISITQFGARGDSATDCRPAVMKAMRKASKMGGARIVVPGPGVYLLKGPIEFLSNVCLDIRQGATLKFVPEPRYYLPMVETSWEGTLLWNYSPFIYGHGLHDVSIMGSGTIDGDAGQTFARWQGSQTASQNLTRQYNHDGTPLAQRQFGEGHKLRPQLIQFFRCERITISDVLIRRAPFWCLHLLQSRNAVLRGLRYDAKLVNNDGIDIESSQDVLIDDVHFDNGDDNIAIKSGRDRDGRELCPPSTGIVVRNCHFKGLHGVVIGSEMSAGVENVFVEQCDSYGYCKRGIFVKTNPDRGGYVRHVYVRNVAFGDVLDLFYVTSMYAGQGLDNHYYSDISDIYVDGLTADCVTGTALVLQGTEARPLRRVSFSHVSVPQVAHGLSFEHTEPVMLDHCFLGPKVGVPSLASGMNINNK